jgi:hypothetical protein
MAYLPPPNAKASVERRPNPSNSRGDSLETGSGVGRGVRGPDGEGRAAWHPADSSTATSRKNSPDTARQFDSERASCVCGPSPESEAACSCRFGCSPSRGTSRSLRSGQHAATERRPGRFWPSPHAYAPSRPPRPQSRSRIPQPLARLPPRCRLPRRRSGAARSRPFPLLFSRPPAPGTAWCSS